MDDDEQYVMLPTPAPGTNVVPLYLAVHVKDVGTTIRGTLVPGARADQWLADVGDMGNEPCEHTLPAVFEFVWVDPATVEVARVSTIDTHLAAVLFAKPESIPVLALTDGEQTHLFDTAHSAMADFTAIAQGDEGLSGIHQDLQDLEAADEEAILSELEKLLGGNDGD